MFSMIFLIVSGVALFLLAKANVGIFSGYGKSLELGASADIQMVEEVVEMTPVRGRFLKDDTAVGLDQVEYVCRFKFRNLTKDKVSVQVGFPLKTWRMAQRIAPIEDAAQATIDYVRKYNFIAQEEGHIYTVRYLREDKDNRYEDLFVWDISFAPEEEKQLQISYSMPMSMAWGIGWKSFEGEKKWHDRFAPVSTDWFGYVTETGRSWHGRIEKAQFSVDTRRFEKYLKYRGVYGGDFDYEREEILTAGDFCRVVEPDGWEEDGAGVVRWAFENYDPQDLIQVEYHLFNMPQNGPDTEKLIEWIHEDTGLGLEDVQDIKDIIKAFYGHGVANPRITNFLAHQVWYPRRSRSEVPAEVLDVLARYKKELG